MPVIYLDIEMVLGIYAYLFNCTNQQAADQLRNPAGLEAALARPAWYATYADADIALQAAVLTHGIAEGQHFVKGNKRTALVSLVTFLQLNGNELVTSQDELFHWMIQLAEGMTVEQLAARIRATLSER